MERREMILRATLELAAQQGLRGISLSQIAARIGMQKASLYHYFPSKEALVAALYETLRQQAARNIGAGPVDFGAAVEGRDALTVLREAVDRYKALTASPDMHLFYRVLLSERSLSAEAAGILVQETRRMLIATKQLFYAMQIHGLLRCGNLDSEALSFAMTVDALINYGADCETAGLPVDASLLERYLTAFCASHCPEKAVSDVAPTRKEEEK